MTLILRLSAFLFKTWLLRSYSNSQSSTAKAEQGVCGQWRRLQKNHSNFGSVYFMQITFTPLQFNGEAATVGCRASFLRGINAEHRSTTFKLRTGSADVEGKICHLDYQQLTLTARKTCFNSIQVSGSWGHNDIDFFK